MGSKLRFSLRRKLLLGATVLCVVLIASATIWWQTDQVAHAALITPNPGLVGWWRFDEGTGTVAGDSSGNGNNGTITGATWVDGKYGKALSFDGRDDYVALSNLNFDTGDFSLEFWFYIAALPSAWNCLINKGAFAAGSGYGVSISDDNKLSADIQAVNGSNQHARSAANVSLGWNHGAVVFDRDDRIYVYLNNLVTEVAYDSGNNNSLSNGDVVKLGAYCNVDVFYFTGILDDVRIYNRALSATEVQQNFQQSPDSWSNLLAKVPKGTTQVMTTLSWQGTGSINVTIVSPSQTYTEDIVPVYQKTAYSTSGGMSSMLNIKRLSVSVSALASDENWYVMLTFDNSVPYQIAVETQK